jgi:hypothetical protein
MNSDGNAAKLSRESLCLFLVLLIGVLDYLTGYELSFSIFYLGPILFVTWFVSRRAGITTSLTGAATWFLADLLSGHEYSNILIPYWNATVRLFFFLTISMLLWWFKSAFDEKTRLISELTEALSAVRTLTGLLPICAWCKNVRDDRGYWKQVELYIEEHSEAKFTHGMCPKCAESFENAK